MPDALEILQRVISCLADEFGTEIKPHTRFAEDLQFDELDWMESFALLDHEFGVSIPDSAAEKWKTVSDAAKWIHENCHA